MNQHDWIEDIARAMYEAPDPDDDTYLPRAWPPRDAQDRDWFMNLAWVAANAGLDVLFRLQASVAEKDKLIEVLLNQRPTPDLTFLGESTERYAGVDKEEVDELLEEARKNAGFGAIANLNDGDYWSRRGF